MTSNAIELEAKQYTPTVQKFSRRNLLHMRGALAHGLSVQCIIERKNLIFDQ